MPLAFIPHDNDLGVWVSSVGLFPTWLFMEALSYDEHVAHVDVKFGPIDHDRRKYFLKFQALPFNCWDCGETPKDSGHWQLFAIGDEAGGTFMEECDLSNLQFPIQMAGVILIVDKKHMEARRRTSYFEFGWATNQSLPFVIAAVGYAESKFSIEAFRDYFGLDLTTPVVYGPVLNWDQEPNADPKFAKRVLEALYKRIETGIG